MRSYPILFSFVLLLLAEYGEAQHDACQSIVSSLLASSEWLVAGMSRSREEDQRRGKYNQMNLSQ